jgi:hypothetical protein
LNTIESFNLLGVEDAVVVGAADASGQTAAYSGQSELVDFTAVPNSTVPGTSFSAPHLAGALASLMDKGMSQQDALRHLNQQGTSMQDAEGHFHKFISNDVINASSQGAAFDQTS